MGVHNSSDTHMRQVEGNWIRVLIYDVGPPIR